MIAETLDAAMERLQYQADEEHGGDWASLLEWMERRLQRVGVTPDKRRALVEDIAIAAHKVRMSNGG